MSQLKFGERYFTNRERLSQVWQGIQELALATHSDLTEAKIPPALDQKLHSPFSFLVCGEVNAGKSSLINSLFDHELCVVNSLPETKKIIRYSYAASHRVDSQQADQTEHFYPLEQLRDFIPIDTPGTNTLNAEQHLAIESLVLKADLILFVFPASNPWGAATWNLITDLPTAAHERMAFVVQQADQLSPADLAVISEHIVSLSMKRIGVTPPIFPVSSKIATEAKQGLSPDHKLFAASGLPALVDHISRGVCYSQERHQILKTWHDHAAQALYLIDHHIDNKTLQQRDHHHFLGSVEDEINAMREALVARLPRHLQEVAEVFENEAIGVTKSLRRWLNIPRSFFKVFVGDRTGIRTESLFVERLRGAVESVAESDGSDIVSACLDHWQDLGNRVKESIGLPIDSSVPIEAKLELARQQFVIRIGTAAHQAIGNLHVRKDLERELRNRNLAIKSFTASALILLCLGAVSGILNFQLAAWILCAISGLFLVGGTLIAWITKSRISQHFQNSLLNTCGVFAETLRYAYEDALRAFFQDYTSNLGAIRQHLARQEQDIEPKLGRWQNLFLTLKSIEQDL